MNNQIMMNLIGKIDIGVKKITNAYFKLSKMLIQIMFSAVIIVLEVKVKENYVKQLFFFSLVCARLIRSMNKIQKIMKKKK